MKGYAGPEEDPEKALKRHLEEDSAEDVERHLEEDPEKVVMENRAGTPDSRHGCRLGVQNDMSCSPRISHTFHPTLQAHTCMIHDAGVSPGCTRAVTTTHSRCRIASEGAEKSVMVSKSALCPASV